MNAFSWLEPVFVAPVAEIERGLFRAPRSYVVVVSKTGLLLADDGSDSDNGDSYSYRRGRQTGARDNDDGAEGRNTEILFFDVHADAAKWLLNASFDSGYASLRSGTANIALRLSRDDLVGPPRAEGATLAMIQPLDEEPRVLSFESALRRDVFLRATRTLGIHRDSDGGSSDDGAARSGDGDGDGDDDDEERQKSAEVQWRADAYRVPLDYEAEVRPAKGVLSGALPSNQDGQNANAQGMSQPDEVLLAREMARNPLFQRGHRRLQALVASRSPAAPLTGSTASASAQPQAPPPRPPISATSSLECAVPAGAPIGVFSLPLFQAECAAKITSTDVKIASLVVAESARWGAMLNDVGVLDAETIMHLEARIETFSHEILSRRSVIDEIEKESLMRQQVKRNLEAVLAHLGAINGELGFSSAAQRDLDALMDVDVADAAAMERALRQAGAIEEAAATVERVLSTRHMIERRFAKLTAVSDRCEQFRTVRRDVARRVRMALINCVTNWVSKEQKERDRARKVRLEAGLSDDQSDGDAAASRGTVITLTPPTDLFFAVDPFVPFLATVRASDLPGYYAAARVVARRINETVVPALGKFVLEVRRRLAQLPVLADFAGASGGPMTFDTDDFVSIAVARRLQRSFEMTATALTRSSLKGGGAAGADASSSSNPFGVDSGAGGAPAVPPPTVTLMQSRDSATLLAPESSTFKWFFLPEEDREAATGRAGLLKRLLRGGDLWRCRPDVAVAICVKGVADLVLSVRNFFVAKLKLRPADYRTSRGWKAAAVFSAGGGGARARHDDDDAADSSAWERCDEVNTFLWLAFRSDGENDLCASSALGFGAELVRLIELVFSSCDLIYAVPIASVLDSVLKRIDDGDANSSAPLQQRSDDAAGTGGAAAATAHSSSASGVAHTPSTERSGFLSHILASALTIANEKLNLFIATQVQGMRASARSLATSGKMRRLLPSFLVFPAALNRVETLLSQQYFPSYDALETLLFAIVPQMFATLDAVTFHDDGSLPAQDADFMQFAHHALFCVAVQNAVLPKTRELLAGKLRFSEGRRDQHEQRYVLRSLCATCFPEFAATAELADGVMKRTVNAAEANSSVRNLFSPERMAQLCAAIPEELPRGYATAKEKLQRHVSLLVSNGDLAVSGILTELVKSCMKHLTVHLYASLAVVEQVRNIVTPGSNSGFYNSCAATLKTISR